MGVGIGVGYEGRCGVNCKEIGTNFPVLHSFRIATATVSLY